MNLQETKDLEDSIKDLTLEQTLRLEAEAGAMIVEYWNNNHILDKKYLSYCNGLKAYHYRINKELK